MTDFTNDNLGQGEPIEARLQEYGAVLRSHLADEGGRDAAPAAVLIGTFGNEVPATAPRRMPMAAVLSAAAAVLVMLALLVPTLVTGDPSDPVTVAGGGFASESNGNDQLAGTDPDAEKPADAAAAEDVEKVPGEDATGDKPTDVTGDESLDSKATDPEDTETAGSATSDADTSLVTSGSDVDANTDWSKFTVAAGGAGATTDPVAEGTDATSPESPAAADEDGSESESKNDAESAADASCPAGAERRGDDCIKVGPPPTPATGTCPTGAVQFAGGCYDVVPPTCGELATAPNGDGCLKLVGAAGSSDGACPANYQRDGDICVKYLAADVTCAQGTPSGGQCVIKETPTGASSGCADGQIIIGNQCYELVSATTNCGDMAELPDGNCRYEVATEATTSCADGFENAGSFCYRYEEPPVVDCGGGTLVGDDCKLTETGVPGEATCDAGVLQDAQGCYILIDPDSEGSCGSLAEQDGKCRKDKPDVNTWDCSDGSVSAEPTCYIWSSPVSITCAAGELVDSGTCKTISDPTSTEACPSSAIDDEAGCYKVKAPTISCGALDVAPDGVNCKQWVGAASAGGGDCSTGFDLVGDYCKKYVDGTATCSSSELTTVNGEAKCRYVQNADGGSGSATGCEAGKVEKDGNCYLIVAPSCDSLGLDVDIYGNGCKQPIAIEGELVCETGYTLVDNECIIKL